MIPILTAQVRTESERREWARLATVGARKVAGLSRADFAVGVSETRQEAFERADVEDTKQPQPRVQLDKIAAWPFVSLLALCRALLGTRAVVVEVKPSAVVLTGAAMVLTKEGAEAVCASLGAHDPEGLAKLEREAMDVAENALGIALAAREKREAMLAPTTLRVARGGR